MSSKFEKISNITPRPDSRGRITLGELANGISKYDVLRNEETGELLLRPFKEIPAREVWLYENPVALQMVQQGLQDAKNGDLVEIDLDADSWADEEDDQ
tara:strand:+ start:239 stop:535 length:297 start_codon:yes stop_codon:yes gene_type:complete